MSAFAGMTKGRVDGKAGRNKNLPKEPVFVKKKRRKHPIWNLLTGFMLDMEQKF